MSLLQQLLEAADGPNPKVMALQGKSFTVKGITYTITKVEYRDVFRNYNLFIDKLNQHSLHPYGDRAWKRALRDLLPKDLDCEFSESGLQGHEFINLDVGKRQPRQITDVKGDLEKAKKVFEDAGYEITHFDDHRVVGNRKGKGTLYVVYLPEDDDGDERYGLGKGGYWITHQYSMDELIKDMTTGFSKKYFTKPKQPK